MFHTESIEFGHRLNSERQIDRENTSSEFISEQHPIIPVWDAIIDESGEFVIYPTLIGIKGK